MHCNRVTYGLYGTVGSRNTEGTGNKKPCFRECLAQGSCHKDHYKFPPSLEQRGCPALARYLVYGQFGTRTWHTHTSTHARTRAEPTRPCWLGLFLARRRFLFFFMQTVVIKPNVTIAGGLAESCIPGQRSLITLHV